MPIRKTVIGDIFKTDIKCIAHGCNTAGVMGSGIAAIVKKKFPQAYKDYYMVCKDVEDYPNTLLGDTVIVEENDKIIFNMFTQGDFSRAFGKDARYVSYDAVAECFEEANEDAYCRDFGLAIPLIGAGLGGGDWTVIEAVINSVTPDIDITLYKLEA